MDQIFKDYLDLFAQLHANCKDLISVLPQQSLDWKPGEDMNSMCVLVTHLTGAERYWIGDVAMGEPSGRIRDDEFLAKEMSAEELIKKLDDSLAYIQAAFERLMVDDLSKTRVSPRDGREFSIGWAISHALEHTALHVGHIQITRQLLGERGDRQTL
jgi:uncharacterized damage-inducible protein DinB